MDLAEAFQIVLDLARQGVIDDPEMESESKRQTEAIDTVEDFVTNNFGDN